MRVHICNKNILLITKHIPRGLLSISTIFAFLSHLQNLSFSNFPDFSDRALSPPQLMRIDVNVGRWENAHNGNEKKTSH